MNIEGKFSLFPEEAKIEFQGKKGWIFCGDFFSEETVKEMLKDWRPPKISFSHEPLRCSMSSEHQG